MEKLRISAAKMGIEIEESRLLLFSSFMEKVLERNKVMNLTAIKNPDKFIIMHYLDSLSLLSLPYFKEGIDVIDIGCGAGFPGVPLIFTRPDLNITLMDSLNKRISFLESVLSELPVENYNCIHSRGEEAARKKEYRENFDIAVSRAVANLPVLCELCIPFVKPGGFFIAMKGPSVWKEVEKAKNAIGTLGGKLADIKKVDIPSSDTSHFFVIIEKIKTTADKYPRTFAKISKKSL